MKVFVCVMMQSLQARVGMGLYSQVQCVQPPTHLVVPVH